MKDQSWQRQLSDLHARWHEINFPEGFRAGFMPPMAKHTDDTTKGLKEAAKAFFKYNGCQVDNNSGLSSFRMEKTDMPNGKQLTKPVFNRMPKGKSDLSVTHQGRMIAVEIKCAATNDTLSEAQYKYYKQITNAGGLFIVVEDMPSLLLWWAKYEDSISRGLFPLAVDATPVQPVIPPPSHRAPTGGIFDTKGQTAAKEGKLKEIDKVLYAAFVPEHDKPRWLQSKDDTARLNELDAAYAYFKAEGFKVAYKQAIRYKIKPPVRIVKRLPKNIPPEEKSKYVEVADGWQVLTEVTEVQEKYCMPDFIVSKGNDVWVIDCKKDCNDWKLFQYAAKVRWILESKGDTRKVLTATVNHAAGGRHKNFVIPM